MKIGLMGGTFDPIHKMHIELAINAKEQCNLDKVLFMTSGNPPHKKNRNVTDAKIRHKMVEIALQDIPSLEPCDYEVNKKEYSYSANTLKWLNNKYPKDDIYFLIGEDSLAYIDKWYHPEEILSLCTLLVYPRTSLESLYKTAQNIRAELGGKIECIDAPIWNISSTQIRDDIKNSVDVSKTINKNVLEYIKENNLYRGEI